MSQESKRLAAMEYACPNCNSGPYQKCTQPTDNGRKYVRYVHLERERKTVESRKS